MARDISSRLVAALKAVDRSGAFCADGGGPAPLPGLEVAGLGPVGLPLTAAQVPELVKRCRQAPYGKGEKTLVDTSVRRVWQLDPDGCDADCTTDRTGSPQTLVCTKTTASFDARLKKYRDDRARLTALRSIQASLST